MANRLMPPKSTPDPSRFVSSIGDPLKGVELQIDMTNAMAIWKRAPHTVEHFLADAFDHIRRKFFKVWPRSTNLKSSGRKWSMIWRFQGYLNRNPPSINSLNLHVVSYSGFSRIQEEGGVIKGVNGRLRIPIQRGGAVLQSGRVSKRWRWYPEEWRTKIADDPTLIPLKSSRGRTIIAKRIKRGPNKGTVRPMFVLVDQVVLRPRLRFYVTWRGMQAFATSRAARALKQAAAALKRNPFEKHPRIMQIQIVRGASA